MVHTERNTRQLQHDVSTHAVSSCNKRTNFQTGFLIYDVLAPLLRAGKNSNVAFENKQVTTDISTIEERHRHVQLVAFRCKVDRYGHQDDRDPGGPRHGRLVPWRSSGARLVQRITRRRKRPVWLIDGKGPVILRDDGWEVCA